MNARYFVIREVTCPECGGSGYVYDSTGFWEYVFSLPEWESGGVDLEEVAVKKFGFAADEFDNGGPTPVPLQEEPCPRCLGGGVLRAEVDLVEALKVFGVLGGDEDDKGE